MSALPSPCSPLPSLPSPHMNIPHLLYDRRLPERLRAPLCCCVTPHLNVSSSCSGVRQLYHRGQGVYSSAASSLSLLCV